MTAWIVWLDSHDERLLLAVLVHRRRLLDRCFRAITHLADPAVAIAVAGSLAVGLVPELMTVGWRSALTLTISHGLVEIVKRTIVRPRPRLPIGLESLVQPPDRFSFPSGHAAAAMAIALPLAVGLGLPGGLLVLALAVLVGISRCYLGVHYPGDVLAGWTIAATATCASGLILA
jgi:undecaprenyl-diphosphatase